MLLSWVLLSGTSGPGKSYGVSSNSDPQPEGYSYVNLAVVTTVGIATAEIVATRPRTTQKPCYGFVVGCPGTLTS